MVGSAKGAPRDPAWTVDLRAHPDTEIEAAIDGDIATVPVRAVELAGQEREAAFARFVEMTPVFASYQARAPRPLPVIRFVRRGPGSRAVSRTGPAVRPAGPDPAVRRRSGCLPGRAARAAPGPARRRPSRRR
ncbi:hypothetical protein GCM10009735_25420 [Actinomadura chokoriensis]